MFARVRFVTLVMLVGGLATACTSDEVPNLEFYIQPGASVVGVPLGRIELAFFAHNNANVSASTYRGRITVALGDSMTQAELGGTTTVTADEATHIATFSDLTISAAGMYHLTATALDSAPSSSSHKTAESGLFTIANPADMAAPSDLTTND